MVVPSTHELSEDDFISESEATVRVTLDPIAGLLEDIGELELFGTIWQAAAFAASVLVKRLGARAVIIHTIAQTASELRIIGTKGANTNDLLGEIARVEDDFVVSTIASNGRPLVMTFDGELPRIMPARFTTIGARSSLVAVPLMASSGCSAVIEAVDVAPSAMPIAKAACSLVVERLFPRLSNGHRP